MKEDKNNTTQKKIGYSFWGLVCSCVGIVIGTGIFFKSGTVIDSSGPALSITSWVIGSIIVVCMMMAYIEVASSTSKTGEVGSLHTWTKKFINIKVAKIIGLFMTFIWFPSLMILLVAISSNFLLQAIEINHPNAFNDAWSQFAFIICISMSFILFVFMLNIFKAKWGEKVQIIGVVIKFIPFFIIVVVGFFMAISGAISGGVSIDTTPVSPNVGMVMNGIFLSIPAILFSFDGFVYASNLQNEMKDKSKFPKAMITSIIIISVTYLLVSFMSVLIGSNGNYSVPEVLNKMFGGQVWITITTLVIIASSGLNGLNGYATTSLQQVRSLSESNIIVDKDKKFQKLDKNNVPRNSAICMFIIVVIWFIILWTIEIINYSLNPSGHKKGEDWFEIIDLLTVANIILGYMVYSLIIFGAIWNRKTNKVPVDEIRFFKPMAWIGAVGVTIFGFYNIVAIFVNGFGVDIGNANFNSPDSLITMIVLLIEIPVVFLIYIINEKYISKKIK